MRKECLIHMSSGSDNDPTGQDIWAVGTCYERQPGIFQVLYEIFEDTEAGSVPTPETMTKHRLKLSAESLEVVKYGPVNTTLEFGPRKKYSTFYNTPYGSMEMEFRTKKYETEFEENRIAVKMEYEIHMNESKLSENHMEIVITGKAGEWK